jgi:hypothetical protein
LLELMTMPEKQTRPTLDALAVARDLIDGLASDLKECGAEQPVAAFVAELDVDACRAVERWARDALASLPVPIGLTSHGTLGLRRALVRRLAAEAAASDGRPDDLLDLQLASWRDGQTAAPYVEHLLALGRETYAAVVARCALSKKTCPDRSRIEAALASIGSPPAGWADAVLVFAADPSLEGWEELMRFTPLDALYHRIRNTIQMMMRLGVDGNVLFRCATRYGSTPDAIELVERGMVDPETVVQRGRDGPPEARGLWLGLAARAAHARGDRLATVRLLEEAYEAADPDFPPLLETHAIREDVDDELARLLDQAGIPRLDQF